MRKKSKSSLKALPLGKKLTVAIDIDGTVADCAGVDFKRVDKSPLELLKAKPIRGALESVKKLHEEGHTIVFYSSRHEGSKAVTERWLREHGFPFHHVEMQKFVAHVYIDDRAINGCSWKQVLREMKKSNIPGKIARRAGRI